MCKLLRKSFVIPHVPVRGQRGEQVATWMKRTLNICGLMKTSGFVNAMKTVECC